MMGLYALVGFRQTGVPYEERPRGAGHTRFGPLRLMRLAATGVTSFSTLPLQVFGLGGVVVSFAAFAYAFWILFEWTVFGQEISGFATLATVSLLFGGLQMLSVAALGAYVGRIYREVKARPLYIVDRIDDAAPTAAAPHEDARARRAARGSTE
ncbi:MAG: hypothetical protein O9345_07745 [Burkholderiaceae bacterium]|jgi:hypothetical protein|nr:hypothetical protein [Burkholderiales bacterium]MCZ8338032.1 hypothetical protein [Burkholderiaceae bacterium]